MTINQQNLLVSIADSNLPLKAKLLIGVYNNVLKTK